MKVDKGSALVCASGFAAPMDTEVRVAGGGAVVAIVEAVSIAGESQMANWWCCWRWSWEIAGDCA
jgi:hypothetical protein